MKKNRRQAMLFLLVVLVGISSHGADRAKITIKIVDEEGKPLAGMPVSAAFYQAHAAKGESDRNGLFVLEGDANMGEANYFAQKDGYYRSEGQFSFSPVWSPKGGRFAPWNPTVTMVVRKVVNPVPMYVKRVEKKIPVENREVGFDLKIGDWVEPHGNGKRPDFRFNIRRRVSASNNYSGQLDLFFANAFDGLQKIESGLFPCCEMVLPRNAPIDGYTTNYVYVSSQDPMTGYHGARTDDPQEYYFFRVRSAVDEKGRLKECLYGALATRIRYSGVASSNNLGVHFVYYLNPTPNDRNMEFDPKRNLFDVDRNKGGPTYTNRPIIGWD